MRPVFTDPLGRHRGKILSAIALIVLLADANATKAGGLTPLPVQPPGTPWPTAAWPRAERNEPGVDFDKLDKGVAAFFDPSPKAATYGTRAILVVYRGKIIAERYAPGFGSDSRFLSMSAAKSFVSAFVGILVGDKRLSVQSPAPVPEWRGAGDPRRDITLNDLLQMSSGQMSLEDYDNPETSTVLPNLFGGGRFDVALDQSAYPLWYAPGTVFSYSSGGTNLISGIVRQAVGDSREAYDRFARRRLYDVIGMKSVVVDYDQRGTFLGSTFLYATAQDYARFGFLYLHDGVWDGRRVLPAGWVDYTRTPAPTAKSSEYGAQFWLNAGIDRPGVKPLFPGLPADTFALSGRLGQAVVIIPSRDTVIVRLSRGKQANAAFADIVNALGQGASS